MYDSKVTDYDVVDATPFGRDPIRELAAACQRQGIKLCFYYSQTQD
jgi:alpha-L-fucosidase